MRIMQATMTATKTTSTPALAAAGALSVADAARLLRIRGRAMQKAVPVGQGAMAALIGLDFGTVMVYRIGGTAAPERLRHL